MRFGKERLLLEIRSHQLLPDEDEEQERPRYRWQRKQRKTRGPLSEGNRPRSIWALEDVQSLMVEILGVAGLNLFDEEGQLMKERKHGQTYKTLQNMLGKDGRDLIETLLRLSHADNKWVVKLEEKAGEGEHFLRADSVARQLVRFMDRLLDHMEVLREVRLSLIFL